MPYRNPWPGRGWPYTRDEERALIDEFAAEPECPPRYEDDEPLPVEVYPGVTRLDVSLLVTLLRHGSTLRDIRSVAPGVNVPALARAHTRLDALRADACDAFDALCQATNEDGVRQHLAAASKLVPIPARRVAATILSRNSSDVLRRIHAERAELEKAWQAASALRVKIISTGNADVRNSMIEALCYPDEASLYHHPSFMARCVAELSSVRVSSLLGEQRPVQPT
jgi:hypothetical protein